MTILKQETANGRAEYPEEEQPPDGGDRGPRGRPETFNELKKAFSLWRIRPGVRSECEQRAGKERADIPGRGA